mmetsp:Transcript_14079/g.38640  ORF Transcript_14079/g.38640 Transcript_14079/m.38640 type:complete len:222 (+) Transcript_14079:105-770(+)
MLLQHHRREGRVRSVLRRDILPVRGAKLQREDDADANLPPAVRVRVHQAVLHHGVPHGSICGHKGRRVGDRDFPGPPKPRPALLVPVALGASRKVRHQRRPVQRLHLPLVLQPVRPLPGTHRAQEAQRRTHRSAPSRDSHGPAVRRGLDARVRPWPTSDARSRVWRPAGRRPRAGAGVHCDGAAAWTADGVPAAGRGRGDGDALHGPERTTRSDPSAAVRD